jgi:caa(3)-type oxidase subunit IV
MPTTNPFHLVVAWFAASLLAGLSLALRAAPLGAWATPVALAIAACKAWIVLSAFMHVKREAASVRLLAWVTVSVVGLLCLGVVADVGLR